MSPPLDSTSHDQTRLQLLDAAEEVFAERGYAAATTREICQRAGMKNVGAINYYFGGKDRLYVEAVKYAMRTCMHGTPFPDWPAGTPPETKLRDFVRTMIARMLEVPKEASMALMSREMTRPTPSSATEEVVREHIRPMVDVLVAILDELLPDLPFERRVLVGFSIVGQCLYYRQNRAVSEVLFGRELMERFSADVLADHIADLTLRGLGKSVDAGAQARNAKSETRSSP
ncbi:MAG TPA: CerR family C-terminal domain-containing protein [Gemmataceae bacterium]|nr:CerR family C-terminal domain-containing protein [Gemmataceae bacterium]